MSFPLIGALIYADGVYPERVIAHAVGRLRDLGIALAGALQRTPEDMTHRHACDLLIEDLATGEVTAIAEHRGKEARGCRLDVGLLTEVSEAVLSSLRSEEPRLLIINKFGKIEADGGGLRQSVAEAVELGIPVLVGVPARNLDRWRAFAGALAVELPVDDVAVARWLAGHGLDAGVGGRPGEFVKPWTT